MCGFSSISFSFSFCRFFFVVVVVFLAYFFFVRSTPLSHYRIIVIAVFFFFFPLLFPRNQLTDVQERKKAAQSKTPHVSHLCLVFFFSFALCCFCILHPYYFASFCFFTLVLLLCLTAHLMVERKKKKEEEKQSNRIPRYLFFCVCVCVCACPSYSAICNVFFSFILASCALRVFILTTASTLTIFCLLPSSSTRLSSRHMMFLLLLPSFPRLATAPTHPLTHIYTYSSTRSKSKAHLRLA